ncbi:hypothetical protein CPB85DRAFT_1252231 [Mucidula mucida]|nr:hypothetical protein CPB85DRAFT_1252231 [Mucidula mucida]
MRMYPLSSLRVRRSLPARLRLRVSSAPTVVELGVVCPSADIIQITGEAGEIAHGAHSRVQKQPPQPEKEDKAWLASQPPPVQDLRLLRRRLRHKRDQEQAKRQAQAEASGVGERALATRERAGASRRGVDE